MRVEIDQSTKIEESGDTFLACANGTTNVVIISKEIKQKLFTSFQRVNKPKLYVYRVFTASLFLLLEPHFSELTTVCIDIEWKGKEKLIHSILIEFFKKRALKYDIVFEFKQVGKHSPAHVAAWTANRLKKQGKTHGARKLSYKDLAELAISNSMKKDRGHKD